MHFFQGVSIVRIGGQDDNCRGSVWIIFHTYINVKLEADFRNQSDWQRQLDCMYNTMMEFHNIIKRHYNSTREIK